jgi:hypothetical protein
VAIAFVGAFRALRRTEVSPATSLGFAAVAIMGLGYLLVESFNVERVELAVLFWFAAGFVVAVHRDTSAETPAPARRRASGDVPAVVGAGVLALALVWFTTAPWRADNAFRNAGVATTAARSLTSSNPQLAAVRSQESRQKLEDAIDASPWEARYLRVRADSLRNSGQQLGQQGDRVQDALAALRQARSDYEDALDLTPHDAALVGSYADTLFNLADLSGDDAVAERATAVLAEEVRYAPRNGRLRAYLGLQRIGHDDRAAGVRDLDAAVAMFPRDVAVLNYAVTGYRAAGLTQKADALERRIERLQDDE